MKAYSIHKAAWPAKSLAQDLLKQNCPPPRARALAVLSSIGSEGPLTEQTPNLTCVPIVLHASHQKHSRSRTLSHYMDSSPQLQHVLKNMAESDPTKLPTPSACLAGEFAFCPLSWLLFLERRTYRHEMYTVQCCCLDGKKIDTLFSTCFVC